MEMQMIGLTDEQKQMKQLCRDFVDKEVIPFIRDNREREWTAPPQERLPWGLLKAADKLGLRSLGVRLVQVPTPENGMVAIASATATFRATPDGPECTFEDVGDANPENVGRIIVPHLIRMASTRAKARTLRDATNIGITALEELGDLNQDDDRDAAASERPAPSRPAPSRSAPDESPVPHEAPARPASGGRSTPPQHTAIRTIVTKRKVVPSWLADVLDRRYAVKTVEDLSLDQAADFIRELQRM